MPRALHKHLGLRPGRWVLPYCYTSIKHKCFQGEGSSRSCSKPHHSCMRRIVSYCKWPCRGVWRQASRALAFVVRQTIFSDEVWGLKDARADMEKKMDRLAAPRRAGLCDRCGGRCHPLQGITADAGQFFEAVSSNSACENLLHFASGKAKWIFCCNSCWTAYSLLWGVRLSLLSILQGVPLQRPFLAFCCSSVYEVLPHGYQSVGIFRPPYRRLIVKDGSLLCFGMARA